MKITIDQDGRNSQIFDSKLCPEPFKFVIPEFRGESNGEAFAIQQVLRWGHSDTDGRTKFQLEAKAKEIGMEFRGSIKTEKHEASVSATVRNVTGNSINSANHAILLDMNNSPAFHDPTGERTFLYAETGWVSQAQLLDPLHSGKHTVMMGASYNAVTVMWKMIARFDLSKRTCIALALDKGYAFAGDHPEWGPGLLGGYRWGSIASMEAKELSGKIYLFKGTLNDLRLKYVHDFKH
jgi:hypothetical protein